ncbi:MAG: hypothetical protein ACLP1D_01200 [Xanthobacteraceae bacterium]
MGLRAEGFLDWQILGLISSIVAQFQVEAQFPNTDARNLSKQIRDRIYRTERSTDPEFDLHAFRIDTVTIQKKILSVAALNTWGLEIHRQTPDFDAAKRLLDARYGHSTDDLPHDDPFLVRT